MNELKQCPNNKACKCVMDEECEGCEEYKGFEVVFNTEEKNLYSCPDGCDNMDVEDHCMKCELGSNFKKRD